MTNDEIPEFLGDRYQSEFIRVMVSIFSLVLFFYLAGQLVSGLVMFEIMLGLSPFWALSITTAVLLFYVVLGGGRRLFHVSHLARIAAEPRLVRTGMATRCGRMAGCRGTEPILLCGDG